jgi:hypothetical protein
MPAIIAPSPSAVLMPKKLLQRVKQPPITVASKSDKNTVVKGSPTPPTQRNTNSPRPTRSSAALDKTISNSK